MAIRYRFLERQLYRDDEGREQSVKQSAEQGSKFTGRLFGGQALSGGLEKLRWLAIVEGEVNAMSCWQAHYETGLDVLSLGSESARLSEIVIAYARQYSGVLLWADKGEIALKLKEQLGAGIPVAVAIRSPLELDANDLLKLGLLSGFLAAKREKAARNDDEREALLWALYDAAMLPPGIDTETAKVLQRLAKQLGKKADIYRPEPNRDRWITSFIPSQPS